MIHPNVLRNVGLDPTKSTRLCFWWGAGSYCDGEMGYSDVRLFIKEICDLINSNYLSVPNFDYKHDQYY